MTSEGPRDVICLDHNPTTPVAPEVFDAMVPCLRVHFGNPFSDHVLGHRARRAVCQPPSPASLQLSAGSSKNDRLG